MDELENQIENTVEQDVQEPEVQTPNNTEEVIENNKPQTLAEALNGTDNQEVQEELWTSE